MDHNWNPYDNVWYGDEKHEYAFDDSSRLIHWTGYSWHANDFWWEEFRYKYEYEVDSENKLISKLSYSWDKGLDEWILYEKNEYAYNDSGWISERIDFDFISPDHWNPRIKYDYTYDEKGNIVLLMIYAFSNEIWSEFEKHETTFDNAGNITNQATYKNLSGSNVVWVGVGDNQVYNYDQSGNITLSATYRWDDTSR